MQLTIIQIGKTTDSLIIKGVEGFTKRLQHYVKLNQQTLELKKKKNYQPDQLKEEEGKLILTHLYASDYVILLDEKGKQFNSPDFAKFLQKKMNSGMRNLVFIIGGAFGFSDSVYARADEKVALSKMTFTHQMVRLFLIEQLYRGMTILKGEKYHH